jgi:predicted glycoside hydrolase/deacetylase ChbG (UPF0249 family)
MPETTEAAPSALLVVVADDAGIDIARNRGIVDAIVRGVVGAVSVLANGAAVEDLAARIGALPSHLRPEIGLHLNLTEGPALAGPADDLTDPAGVFRGDKQAFWTRALAGDVPHEAVHAEALAQIARLVELGLAPTRVDGHQHVHALPGVRDGLAHALDETPSIRWVRLGRPVSATHDKHADFPRIPAERVARPWVSVMESGRVAQAALGTLHDECGVLRAGRREPDVFAGADLVAECTAESLAREIDAAVRLAHMIAPDGGVIEMMTHPGECDFDSVEFSADEARETETSTICADQLRELLAGLGVRLGRFADAAPRESHDA